MSMMAYAFTAVTAAAALGFVIRGSLACRIHDFLKESPRMSARDLVCAGIITLIYAAAAFWGLGDRQAPESFFELSPSAASVTMQTEAPANAWQIRWYAGTDTGSFTAELSPDGVSWSTLPVIKQDYIAVLKWNTADISGGFENARYVRISARGAGVHIGEIALFDKNGVQLPLTGGGAMTDEQELVPKRGTYMNSTYFDEIYHVRTAWEHIQNEKPYEITHPPLGKIMLSAGIRLWGLNPFGWRFMGTLAGVLMLPLLYIFIKKLFGITAAAVCGTAVFAFDFMHFTQTRIATIDSYSVLFILLMFLFMYEYFSLPYDAPVKRTVCPLFFSGLFFGIGAASKWTVLYGGAGLAVIWLIRQILCLKHDRGAVRRLIPTILLSLLFFLVVPGLIYIAAYIPYGTAEGIKLFGRDYFELILNNQKYMLNYHGQLTATHPYQSQWWQWVLDLRPILLYRYSTEASVSAFASFGNPLFWWGGLCAMVTMVFKTRRGDKRAMFILTGWLSCILPWVFISRCAFIYHYFPCTLFLALALCYIFYDMCRASPKGFDKAIAIYTAGCGILFAVFYPALTGVEVPRTFTAAFLRWFGGMWPF